MSRALKVTPLPPFPFNGKAMLTEEQRKKKTENMYNRKNSRRSGEKKKYLEFIGTVKT